MRDKRYRKKVKMHAYTIAKVRQCSIAIYKKIPWIFVYRPNKNRGNPKNSRLSSLLLRDVVEDTPNDLNLKSLQMK